MSLASLYQVVQTKSLFCLMRYPWPLDHQHHTLCSLAMSSSRRYLGNLTIHHRHSAPLRLREHFTTICNQGGLEGATFYRVVRGVIIMAGHGQAEKVTVVFRSKRHLLMFRRTSLAFMRILVRTLFPALELWGWQTLGTQTCSDLNYSSPWYLPLGWMGDTTH